MLDMKKKCDYIVSACLAGLATRFDGTSCKDKKVSELVKQGKAIPVCPEILGGLKVPRPCAQIVCGQGKDVLSGKAKVVNQNGEDITEFFLKGAYRCLEIAKLFGIRKAILKDKSPSCGCGKIYTKKKAVIAGDGVAASLLKSNRIKVFPV